jgi:hypothetical protein
VEADRRQGDEDAAHERLFLELEHGSTPFPLLPGPHFGRPHL